MQLKQPIRHRPGSYHSPVGISTGMRMSQLEETIDLLRSQVRQAQQLASMGTAAATLAHEMNNLLTPIVSYVDAALGTKDEKLRDKAFQVTAKNANMLIAMSRRVLQISAPTVNDRRTTSLKTIVHDAIDSLGRELDKDGIALKVDVPESMNVHVDHLQIQQALYNVFHNARDALADHGQRGGSHLSVTADREGDRIMLRIKDTGGGIDPEVLPFIFDRLRSSKTAGTGSAARCKGLGLALCRDLIEENGGTIRADSALGVGTTFTIELPAADPEGLQAVGI